ncbi:hypothetical protein [Curvivirga aplysinae]|uniref:hypothetical protein n=1 Tax=Curvivirga aplysinae TaxID=2529852 RepID=UPI0012BCF8C8|nr:hypothetical protein [Curvivirga aplysinae]MTI09262.1 hypothetical protein [Curvivirga aplysinae]
MRRIAFISTLICSTLLMTEFAIAQQSKWLPLGGIGRALMPGETKNPRFKHGDTRVNFFVEGSQLDSLLNPDLSTGCVLGEFNQIKRRKYFVNVRLPDNSVKRFGFATGNGYNLRDYNSRRNLDEVYLFDLDGTSECRVYSIMTPGG